MQPGENGRNQLDGMVPCGKCSSFCVSVSTWLHHQGIATILSEEGTQPLYRDCELKADVGTGANLGQNYFGEINEPPGIGV